MTTDSGQRKEIITKKMEETNDRNEIAAKHKETKKSKKICEIERLMIRETSSIQDDS